MSPTYPILFYACLYFAILVLTFAVCMVFRDKAYMPRFCGILPSTYTPSYEFNTDCDYIWPHSSHGTTLLAFLGSNPMLGCNLK